MAYGIYFVRVDQRSLKVIFYKKIFLQLLFELLCYFAPIFSLAKNTLNMMSQSMVSYHGFIFWFLCSDLDLGFLPPINT